MLFQFFDEIRVEDPRVAEFCAKTTEPSPHDILLTCLQRNFGLGDLKISYQGNTLKHQGNEFTMTVGKHTTTVVCKNKRDGKQRASQAILQVSIKKMLECDLTKFVIFFFEVIASAYNVMGLLAAPVWEPICENVQRKETGRTRNYVVTK